MRTSDFVASSVTAASAELASSGNPLVALRVKETSGSRVVFLAPGGTKSPAYVLKLRKLRRLVPATARKREQLSAAAEYDAIGGVARYFSGIPEFAGSVPRPIKLLKDHDAFVTEFIEGRSLKDILPIATGLLSTASSRSALRSVCYKCGIWLGLQHLMPIPDSLPSRAFDLERLRQKSDTAVALLPESTRRTTAIRDLRVAADDYARPLTDDVTCHGDFQPGNIFVRDGEPFVIDFGTMGVGPAEDDLA
ncbi:MAG: aminoglycoside phosphotransferase family protein, partial [Anaerolineales bacterium]|nr:aminoglycoside phosphotransferase family protein [Anaerolineales bacterium]